MTNRHSIPTLGPRGIQFRSRLEARWAFMFESFNWKWEFEPFDLKGYIPDFIVQIDHREFLVEVKGTLKVLEECGPWVEKILDSEWEGYYLVVGSSLELSNSKQLPVIGAIGHTQGLSTRPCTLGYLKDKWVVMPKSEGTPGDSMKKINELWALAQNSSQWKGVSSLGQRKCEICGDGQELEKSSKGELQTIAAGLEIRLGKIRSYLKLLEVTPTKSKGSQTVTNDPYAINECYKCRGLVGEHRYVCEGYKYCSKECYESKIDTVAGDPLEESVVES